MTPAKARRVLAIFGSRLALRHSLRDQGYALYDHGQPFVSTCTGMPVARKFVLSLRARPARNEQSASRGATEFAAVGLSSMVVAMIALAGILALRRPVSVGRARI